MHRAMDRLVILTSVMALAASSANCAREASSILAPSALGEVGAQGNRGKPGGGSSSVTLAMVTDSNENGLPNWGDRVTFNVSTTATTKPNVSLTCSQNGVVVYGAVTGYYEGYPWPWTQNMTLSSNTWQGGSADCTARLYYISGAKAVTLASMRFTAYD